MKRILAAIAAGILQVVLVGAAFHSFGLNAHGWAVVCLAAGAAQGLLVLRAFPAPSWRTGSLL